MADGFLRVSHKLLLWCVQCCCMVAKRVLGSVPARILGVGAQGVYMVSGVFEFHRAGFPAIGPLLNEL